MNGTACLPPSHYSIADIIDHKIPKDRLEGRIVLVGATEPGIFDLRTSPVGVAYPGVEIHATLLDNDACELMKQHGVYMVPTLSALAITAASRPGCGIPESSMDKASSMTRRHQASFKKAHRSGILIAMGTDAGTPFNYHGDNAQELDRMVALGMTQ